MDVVMWLPEATRVQRLEPVTGRVRVVVDTDAANEIDDQFALAYAILSPEVLAVEPVYAAPFQRPAPGVQDADWAGFSVSPADGMAQSHAEIMRVLEALDANEIARWVYRGAEHWLPNAETPVANPAADDLIARARQRQCRPVIRRDTGSANQCRLGAARRARYRNPGRRRVVGRERHCVVTGSGIQRGARPPRLACPAGLGVPLIHVPCYQVTEKLMTTHHEIEQRVAGRGAIGSYLAQIFRDFDHAGARSKPLWDLGPIAWLVQPGWCPSMLTRSPVLHDDLSWGHEPSRHLIREIRDVMPTPS